MEMKKNDENLVCVVFDPDYDPDCVGTIREYYY